MKVKREELPSPFNDPSGLRSRFHLVRGREGPWLFDERSMELVPLDDHGVVRALEEAMKGTAPAVSSGETEYLAELGRFLDEAPALSPPVYHTRSRVSNLKLALSSRCPSDCAYCFRDRSQTAPAPLGVGMAALDAMVRDHGADARLIVVSYNLTSEPLADIPALKELHERRLALERETGKAINIYVCTSGTIRSSEALELLETVLRGNRLGLSIDGPREVHDRFRRDAAGRGTWQDARAMIDWARSRGIGVEAQAVLTRAFPRPLRVLESLLDLGVHSATIKPVRCGFAESFTTTDLPTLRDAYDEYFERVDEALRNGNKRFFEAVKHDFPLRPLWKFVLRTRAEGRCFWGSSHVVVDAQGRYWPCDSVVGRDEFLCGTVKDGIDWNAFHRDVSWRVRDGCPGCWARGLCGGTCYVNGLELGGDHLEIDPFECGLSLYFTDKCLELAANIAASGVDPRDLGPVLLRY